MLNLTEIKRHIKNGVLPKATRTPNGCEICVNAKYHKRYQGSLTNAVTMGHLHADTDGKLKTTSENGEQYFVTIVDEYSRFVHVKPIPNKTQASNSVREFVKWFEKQSNRPVLSLHTDGGTEFFEVQNDLKKEGTDITYTTAYTPQSNGLAERYHGVVSAQSRAILRQ